MRVTLVIPFMMAVASAAAAQSLHLPAGTNGAAVEAGWAVGPISKGVESVFAASIDGRVDVGVQVSHYTLTFDDGSEASFEDYAPFVRWFAVKQQSGAPVSLAVSGQLFIDDYEAESDSGKYVQLAANVYKALGLKNGWSITPFGGFAFVAESYAFGGGPSEEAQYLTRDFGIHFVSPEDRPWMLRFTLLDQSFRRETYRSARVGVIRRF